MKRIYTWYIDGDFLLLKFMCHRGAFRKDINEKCLLCETEDNGIEHVINNCKKLINQMLKQKIKHYLKQLNIIIIVKNYLILKMVKRKIIKELN